MNTTISKIKAPDMSEYAQALNDAKAAAVQVASDISKIKYIYPPPKLDKFANALSDVVKVGKDAASKIQKLKYEFPPPKLDKFADALNDALKAAKQTASKISSLKPSFTTTHTIKTVKKTVTQSADLAIADTEANSWMNGANPSREPAVKNIHIHNHIHLPPKELRKLLTGGIAENYSKMI